MTRTRLRLHPVSRGDSGGACIGSSYGLGNCLAEHRRLEELEEMPGAWDPADLVEGVGAAVGQPEPQSDHFVLPLLQGDEDRRQLELQQTERAASRASTASARVGVDPVLHLLPGNGRRRTVSVLACLIRGPSSVRGCTTGGGRGVLIACATRGLFAVARSSARLRG
jgi:hypothetical protein